MMDLSVTQIVFIFIALLVGCAVSYVIGNADGYNEALTDFAKLFKQFNFKEDATHAQRDEDSN